MSNSTKARSLTRKKVIGLVVAVAIIIIGAMIPGNESLSREGVLGLVVLFAAVALWICESIPMGVAGLLALVAATLFGITKASAAFTGFGTTTVIFAITIFGLTAIVAKSNIAIRLSALVTKWAGNSSNKLVLGFMSISWLLSTVMNDSAVLVMVIALSSIVIKGAGHTLGESRLAKALYIGIALAAFIGGGVTPAGSSINVLVMGMFESAAGVPVSFLGWMVCCAPVCLVMLPLTWFSIVKILKPESISHEATEELLTKSAALGAFSAEEKKVLVFLIVMPILWIAGSWVPALSVTTVSIVGLACMFLPGIRLLTFKEFESEVPWDLILMMGSVLSLGTIASSTGGVNYLASLFLSTGVTNLGAFLSLFIIMIVAYVFHTFVPIGPGLCALMLAPLMTFCVSVGISPAVPGMIMAIIFSGNFLVPFNPGMALAYRDNCWTVKDLVKVGIVPAFCFVLLLCAWVPFAAAFMGVGI